MAERLEADVCVMGAVLTRLGHLLREPFGRVHWAGTETATISHGAMDGAARSRERAAAEIVDRLS